jgi:hypothetical protein
MALTDDQIAWLQRNKAMSGGSGSASPASAPGVTVSAGSPQPTSAPSAQLSSVPASSPETSAPPASAPATSTPASAGPTPGPSINPPPPATPSGPPAETWDAWDKYLTDHRFRATPAQEIFPGDIHCDLWLDDQRVTTQGDVYEALAAAIRETAKYQLTAMEFVADRWDREVHKVLALVAQAPGKPSQPAAAPNVTNDQGNSPSSGVPRSLFYVVTSSELTRLDKDLRLVAGDGTKALASEGTIASTGQSFGIDATDPSSFAAFAAKAFAGADQDKVSRVRNYKTQYEGLCRDLETTATLMRDVGDQLADLEVLKDQNAKNADSGDSPGKAVSWVFDFLAHIGSAVLEFSPAATATATAKAIIDAAGCDLFKDAVGKLTDTVMKVKEQAEKTVAYLGKFADKEIVRCEKTLSQWQQQWNADSEAWKTAAANFEAAARDLLTGQAAGTADQQAFAAVSRAISAASTALESVGASLAQSPLRDDKYQKAMVPLGDFSFEDASGVFYNKGAVTNAFHKASGIDRTRIEEMSGSLPDAINTLQSLDAARARVAQLVKAFNSARDKAFGF